MQSPIIREDAARRINLGVDVAPGSALAVPRIVQIWQDFGIRQTAFVLSCVSRAYPDSAKLLVKHGRSTNVSNSSHARKAASARKWHGCTWTPMFELLPIWPVPARP